MEKSDLDQRMKEHMKHHRAGMHPSSYHMNDPETVFRELALKEGDVFLDVGCGAGDYSIQASRKVGVTGIVIALDKRQDLIDRIRQQIPSEKLDNIKPIVADMTGRLPIEDQSIDVCMISTVLHCIDLAEHGTFIFREIHRVLKPTGHVVIIECKKEDQTFGPPKHMRLSPEDIEGPMTRSGFKKLGSVVDLGYNYLIRFGKE